MSCNDCVWCNNTVTRKGSVRCTHPESPWEWCSSDISCRRYAPKPPTVFETITASPEVLAPKLVYKAEISETLGDLSYSYQSFVSTIIPDLYFEKESEAIAATVAELKEIYNV